jgi:hypothetical protein
MPAKASIQRLANKMDSRLRGNDKAPLLRLATLDKAWASVLA